MSFPYKNPVAGIPSPGTESPSATDVFGASFSVGNVGGHMEVFSLQDLNYSTFGATGTIANSGNTIPVDFYLRPAPVITDRIVLASDGISSGRRRLGMLAYVYENDTTYQFHINDYETLWNAAVADGAVTSASTSYTISNRVGGQVKAGGQALIAAWTGSTIEGQNGVTRENARWRIYYGTDVQITGGTYNSGTTTLELYNSTGGTISVSGFTNSGGGGGSEYEYIGLNSVPSSYGILSWSSAQSFADAFIAIPQNLNNKTITKVVASYGDVNSDTNAQYSLQMKDTSGSVVGSVSWTHTGGARVHSETFGTALTLLSGHTLNLSYSSTPPDSNAKGYSATFEVTT